MGATDRPYQHHHYHHAHQGGAAHEDRMERTRSPSEMLRRAEQLMQRHRAWCFQERALLRQVERSTGWPQRLLKEELRYCRRGLAEVPLLARQFLADADAVAKKIVETSEVRQQAFSCQEAARRRAKLAELASMPEQERQLQRERYLERVDAMKARWDGRRAFDPDDFDISERLDPVAGLNV